LNTRFWSYEIISSPPLHGMSTEQTRQITAGKYRPEIDGLRAFAVVAVIINHFNKDVLPGGYLGVDIFFVISGYVITSSLYGRPSKDFKDFISSFYGRRIKRLVPALIVFVAITGILITLFNPAPDRILLSGIYSLTGVSNVYFFSRATDYFAQSTALNPFTHTWSLGVEEQFYILFPFLIWFSGFGRQTKNGARNLFISVGALTIASLIGFLYLYPTNQPAAYFLMPPRFWEMAAGCLIFIGFQKRASIEKFLEKVPPLLVLVLIIGVMYLPTSMATVSTIAVVALSSIIIASLKEKTLGFKILTHPRIVYVGLISYSLYLWHWSILTIGKWTIGISPLTTVPLLVLTLGAARLSYTYIEQPFRHYGYKSRFKLFLLWVFSIFITAGILVFIQKNSRFLYTGQTTQYGVNPAPKGDTTILGIDPKSNDSYRAVVITGDSFSGHYYHALDSVLRKQRKSGVIHVRGKGIESIEKDLSNTRNYAYLSRVVDKYLASKPSIKLLIFSVEYNPNEFHTLKQTLEDNIERLSGENIEFLVIGPTPYFREGVFALCQEEWFRPRSLINSNCAPIERKQITTELQPYNRYLSLIETQNPNVHVFYPFSYLCPRSSKYCSPLGKDGSYMYHDANHLSVDGASRVVEPLNDLLERILR
jgi:peptidoglycan/LPS O-acetylase OafA/YrhL